MWQVILSWVNYTTIPAVCCKIRKKIKFLNLNPTYESNYFKK
ncbi:hypothetical protein WN944_004896 [Citrus x changshan-huyou]|uniref:Uncharacterized protein n=1 Tax=Citrus x changshan-huyou TaxID=2935761 RepID=A0AAP0M1E4_9ROSI